MHKPFHILIIFIFFASFFITKNTYAWIISQNYDSEVAGSKCTNWTTTQSTVSTTESVSKNNSCKQTITKGSSGFGQWGGVINLPTNLHAGDEIWIRIRTYFPVGFDYDAHPWLKFMRINTFHADNTGIGHIDWYIDNKGKAAPFRFIYETQDLWSTIDNTSFAIKLGTWETYEWYIKFGTKSVDNGGTARIRAWKNGILMKDMTSIHTLKEPDAYAKYFFLFTYWNSRWVNGASEGAPKTESMYVDDLIITNDQPKTVDAEGNHYIGMGGFIPVARPGPPTISQ